MNVLTIADIHGDVDNLMILMDKISSIKFDVIVCVGDFTDAVLPKGFTHEDVFKILYEQLKMFGKPILAVPGNFDKELISYFENEKISLHGNGKIIENVGFYGFGGARTPFKTPLEFSEDEIRKGLEKGFEEVKDSLFKVQVTHMPPFKTKVDLLYTGAHVGSEVIRKFIEEKKPHVAISAHIHEARGVDEIGETKLINPGRFPEGYCGLVTIKKEKVSVEIIELI